MARNTPSDQNPSPLRGDRQPADAGDEALVLELPVPNETDLSWVDRGWLSAFEDKATEPKDDPAGGELAVGLTGDMYYIAPGTPEKLDDAPGDQLLGFLMLEVPEEQDSVSVTPA